MKAITLPEYNTNIVRALRSLEVKEKEIPQPSGNQVLIKMKAAPCNPSDIAFMMGNYNITRELPAVPGFEASGEVVDAGYMREARGLISNRVCCFLQEPSEDGTWAEYFVTDWKNCIAIRSGISDEEAATLCINPFTAYALYTLALKKGCRSFIQNAASGQIGLFLNNLAKDNGIEVINLVRKDERKEELIDQGFKNILNINDENFEDKLQNLAHELDARIAFDAVGGELSGSIFNAMPSNSELILYGGLSGQRLGNVKNMDLIFRNKSITGFNLSDWKHELGLYKYQQVAKEVQELAISGTLKSQVQGVYKLEEVQEALRKYIKNMSAGKILFTP